MVESNKENRLYEFYIRNDLKSALKILQKVSYFEFIQMVHYLAHKDFYDKYVKEFLYNLLSNRDLREEDVPLIDKLINKALEKS